MSEPRVTLVLGGTRSGKSAIAERLTREIAAGSAEPVTYLATATVFDEEMERRVSAHRERRPSEWKTVELEAGQPLPKLLAGIEGTVLLDSLGTWVASSPDLDVDSAALVRALLERHGSSIVVSEEVGLAVHPPTAVGRAFVDCLGLLNQSVAEAADRVLLVVAGRTLEL